MTRTASSGAASTQAPPRQPTPRGSDPKRTDMTAVTHPEDLEPRLTALLAAIYDRQRREGRDLR